MKTFTVNRREVHISFVEIEAESPEEAIQKVEDGEGEEQDYLEYSHTLETEYWTVDEKGD